MPVEPGHWGDNITLGRIPIDVRILTPVTVEPLAGGTMCELGLLATCWYCDANHCLKFEEYRCPQTNNCVEFSGRAIVASLRLNSLEELLEEHKLQFV